MTLPHEDPRAHALRTAVYGGDTATLEALLERETELANRVVLEADGTGRTPLHLLADWPGHRPRAEHTARLLARAGAEPNTAAFGMWHSETPLHWAASNDDLVLIDALLDAGADIEHPGSSIDGGSPIQSALGYGQWQALRRLYEHGAHVSLVHHAALGNTEAVTELLAGQTIEHEELGAALWNACRRGDALITRLLLRAGADPGWAAPWSGETPTDVAQAHLTELLGEAH